jgi:histidine triad (HIT) family protein
MAFSKNTVNCIFCRIVAGQAEASKVYEDDRVLAFMDIQPVRPGQILVIPKEHIDHFSDIPDDLALEIYSLTHRLSRTVRSVLSPERVGLVVHGYGVSHAHMVIVPQHDENDITSGRFAVIKDGRVNFTIKHVPVASRKELDDMARLIREK